MEVILTLGLPASGKSFFIEKYLCCGYRVIDPDNFIGSYPDDYKARNAQCVKQAQLAVEENASHIVVSAGGSDKFEETLLYYRAIGCTITVFYFDTSIPQSKWNNSVRDRHVPSERYEPIYREIQANVKIAVKLANYFFTITPLFK